MTDTRPEEARAFAERCASEFGGRALSLAQALTLSRTEAEDVVQQALLVALTKTPSEDPWAWFAGVVVNTARNRRRKRWRRSAREGSLEGASLPSQGLDPAERAEREELIARLHSSLAELPEDQREALALTHLAGLSHKAAAESLGVARETVTARARKGLDSLRSQLGAKEVAAALTLAAAGLELSKPSGVVPGFALGGLLMTTSNKIALGLAGLALFLSGGLVAANLPDAGGEASKPPTSPLPAAGAKTSTLDERPALDPEPTGLEDARARIKALEAERDEHQAARARLRAENERLERALAAAEAARKLSVVEELRAAGKLPAAERRSVGWKLGRGRSEEITAALILEVLTGESDPGVLEAFYEMLRGGASERWQGEGLERVVASLQDPLEGRRRAASLLLSDRLRRGVRALPTESMQAFEEDRLADPQLRRIQDSLTMSFASGNDAVLIAAGKSFGSHSSGLWGSGRQALREGAARAETHQGRVAAYYALGRDRWDHGVSNLFKIFEGSQRPELRLAIGEALSDVWRSQYSANMFKDMTPKVHALYRDAGEARVRKKILKAWAHAASSDADQAALLAGLRREQAWEPDPDLRAAIQRVAEALAAGQVNGSAKLDELFATPAK